MALRKSTTQSVLKSRAVYLPGPQEPSSGLARANPCWKTRQEALIMYRIGLMGSLRHTDSTSYRLMTTAAGAQLYILLADSLLHTWPR